MSRPALAVLAAALDEAMATAVARLAALPDAGRFDPAAARVLVETGLGRLALPVEAGGFGAGLADACRVLAAVGAVDGSAALGLAMNTHVVGSLARAGGWPASARDRLFGAICDEGALVNNAATEERGGSPARGALPDTTARATAGGTGWILDGEKAWTTFLPALRFAVVSARVEDGSAGGSPEIGNFLVDLGTSGWDAAGWDADGWDADGRDADGVERLPAFEALGMRGSASGRLRLTGVHAPADALVTRRSATAPDPRGAAPGAWFAACVAAVYLGVGEGARTAVVRWAVGRHPADGTTAVADLPTVQLRLGRLDVALRVARTVLFDALGRWDAVAPDDSAAQVVIAGDIAMAKLTATNAAVEATDEALRIAGGPGFVAGPIERAFRDARAGLINPPIDDVLLGGFGRALVHRERDAERARRV